MLLPPSMGPWASGEVLLPRVGRGEVQDRGRRRGAERGVRGALRAARSHEGVRGDSGAEHDF